MIDRKRILKNFFQVKKNVQISLAWSANLSRRKKNKGRSEKLNCHQMDILIPSANNKFWNKINKNGAANIEIPAQSPN